MLENRRNFLACDALAKTGKFLLQRHKLNNFLEKKSPQKI